MSDDAEDMRAAVGRLRGSQPTWEALGPTGRGAWLGRLRVTRLRFARDRGRRLG